MLRPARIAAHAVTMLLITLSIPAAANAVPTVGQDAFARDLSGGWGTADVGGTWSVLQGPASALSVNGVQGRVHTPPGYANTRLIHLSSKSLRDVDVKTKMSFTSVTGTGAYGYGSLVLRNQADGRHFRVGLWGFSTGKLLLHTMTSSGEVIVPDKDTGISFSPGHYMVRAQATGANPTTVRAKVWKVGSAEPTTWQQDVKTTRGPQTTGTVGLRTSVLNTPSPVTVGLDDVVINDITPPPPDLTRWQLLESDDFNGTAVNTAKWTLYNAPGHGGNGLRRPAQVKAENGSLVITAEMLNGVLNSGGMVHKNAHTYGRYEFRIRTEADPSGSTSGVALTWPVDGLWPIHGENDIYETGIDPDRMPFHTFVHYDAANLQKFFSHNVDGTQWHVMAMEWEANAIRIYRDGELVWTLTDTAAIPDVAHKLAFQLDAVDPTMGAPVKMYVDYARIYKKVV